MSAVLGGSGLAVRLAPWAAAGVPAGRRDRSPATADPVADPSVLFPAMGAWQVVALAAAVVAGAALAGWLWWRRDHRGWATGADLGRHLSVDALLRAAPQVRPGMAVPGVASRAAARLRRPATRRPVAPPVALCPGAEEGSP